MVNKEILNEAFIKSIESEYIFNNAPINRFNKKHDSNETFKELIIEHGLYTEDFYCYKGFYENTLTEALSNEMLNNFSILFKLLPGKI